MNNKFGKDVEGRGRGLIKGYYSDISLGRMRKISKYLCQDSRSLGRFIYILFKDAISITTILRQKKG
jgi:hypothetical protein